MNLQLPSSLVAHAAWAPPSDAPGAPWIVYATHRARRRLGLSVCFIGLAYVLTLLFFTQDVEFYLIGLIVVVFGAGLQSTGGSGYYAVDADGVTEHISWRPPTFLLQGRRKVKVKAGVLQVG
ncbi:hypothetical protein [Dactylosporangium sp. NPDC048998]|uniref:hypothetical protein n=1 Tax=Dactylosporangium sp. NPDC048998 TaxID=3363976 RepID=UPI003710E9EF